MTDPITEFAEASHEEKGRRVSLTMRKESGDAGFCIRAKGGKKAIDRLVEIMNGLDLNEHQEAPHE